MPTSGRDRRIPAAHVGEVEPAPPSFPTEFHVVRHDLLPSGDEWAVLRRSTVMKFDVDTASRPRRIAKALQAALGRRGIPVPLHTCQSLVARMYGHEDWHGLTHAKSDGGPSPFDEDVDTATAAARHQHQVRVLTGGDLPEAIAREVIEEVRPTASGRQRRPTPLPRIRVMGCRTADDGSVVEIGEQDVTRRMVEYIKAYGLEKAMERIANPHTAAVLLRDDLTPAAYEQFYSRSFYLDRLPAAVEAFVDQVGSADHMTMSIFSSRLDRLNRRKWKVGAIEAAVAEVSAATLHPDRVSDDMFYRPSPFSTHNDYVGEPCEAYDSWAYDEFCVLDTPPAHGTPAYGEWLGRLAEWSRVNAPPVVFGTFPEHWTGVREEDVREAFADLTDADDGEPAPIGNENGELDHKLASEVIEQILASLQNHHEDAGEEIVDLDAIEPILVEWHPHAGSGDAIDLGLKARLDEWNARQTIVSYYPDMSVIVPSRPGVTQADVDRWTASAVRLATERMNECDRWERVKPKLPLESIREPQPNPVGEERVEVVLSTPRP